MLDKQPLPTLIRQEGVWDLKYQTIHEDSNAVISVTSVRGSSLEDIIAKVVIAHQNATLFAERLRAKLADLQVENSRSKQ